MESLLTIDAGHLLEEGGDPGALVRRYGGSFAEFQESLRENRTPLTLSFEEEKSLPEIKRLAGHLRDRYANVLVLGIGGSALGFRAVLQFLKGPFYNLEKNARPRVFVLDNIDPAVVAKLGELLDFSRTALIYTSKSGSTPETAAGFLHFYRLYREAGGDPRDLVIICDRAENGINRIAKNLGCHLLPIPRDLPGRYSVLSSVGFLPSEIAGIDSAEMLAGARAVHRAAAGTPAPENAVFVLGAALYEHALRGRSVHVLFNYSSLLFDFGLWFMQLWAESLGKRLSTSKEPVHAGTTPLACLGATDQHSLLQLFKEGPDDKVYGFVKIGEFPADVALTGQFPAEKEYAYFAGHTFGEQLGIEALATEVSLAKAGRPCYRITLKGVSPSALGALFYFFEALVVYSAHLWRVNPFDQPGVEEGKKITYALLGREDFAALAPVFEEEIAGYNRRQKLFKI
ncbi:MAG: glucose-6-phosphate isomerase [Desulfotomaculales bacterium]